MTRGPDGRYGYQAAANQAGPVSVTCCVCGNGTTGTIYRYIRKVPTGETRSFLGFDVPVTIDRLVIACPDCGRSEVGQHALRCECQHCGRVIHYTGSCHVRYCTSECLDAARLHRRHHAAELAKMRRCGSCGRSFAAPRRDAAYCSPACRQAAYRKRLADLAARRARDAAMLASYNAGLYGGSQ